MKPTRHFLTAALAIFTVATVARADEFADLAARHPASAELSHLFAGLPDNFQPTRLTRADYLPLIAGNVDYWIHFQNPAGAIIDPYEKRERQYSTPAFALASAILIKESHRKDLLDASTRAFTFSVTALANHTTADQHADFYIPMLMHAHRILAPIVAKEISEDWDRKLRSLIPEKTYHDTSGGGNWNLVNVSGDLLRRKDGLLDPDQATAESAYIERSLAKQLHAFTKFGMYRDPNSPLAYDEFPRLWLEDVLADNAYTGPHAAAINDALRLGGISSLLLLSPTGEWPSGGRSANHQWNEAANAVICECNASYWKAHGNLTVAGAFKNAARLSIMSLRQWQRPSGEFRIVKNFADPARRFGYEGYSFSSQYSLLPSAMLAIAYERADDSIDEYPKPGNYDNYVFDLRDTFHKIIASNYGNYIEINTAADPHYDSTGLTRLHRMGIPLSPLSDTAASHRVLGPSDEKPNIPLSPGLQWQDSPDSPWTSLANFVTTDNGFDAKHPATQIVTSVDFQSQPPIHSALGDSLVFTLTYHLKGPNARPLTETYTLTPKDLTITTTLAGDQPPAALRFAFPALTSDGVRATQIQSTGPTLSISRPTSTLSVELLSPKDLSLHLDGPQLPCHIGYLQPAIAPLPPGTKELTYRLTLANHE